MTKFKIENVWEILKTFDFNKENEIESDLSCLLCKKLLINAYISPCACRFCFDCISKYLNKEKKVCPGNTDDCKNELLCLNENIVIDHAVNIRISKLNVKCPQKSCDFTCELRNIDDHIRICNYRSVCCPYLNIGCNSSDMHAGNVIEHLKLEIEKHTNLLIDCIDNLNNEIERLKIIVDKLGEENKIWKCEMKLDGEKKQEKCYEQMKIIVDKLEEENKMLKCEINKMKLDGEKKQEKYDEQMREIDLLNEDMVALRNVDKYTRDDVDELTLDGKKKQIEIDKLNKKLQEIESKLDGERKEKELEKKCAEQTCKIDLLNAEIVKLRNVDKCMREDVEKLKLDGERNKKLIGTLEKKGEQQNEEQIQQFNKKYREIENKFVNAKQERENKEKDLMRNEIDEMRNKQTEMRTMSNKIYQTMKDVENKLLEIEISNQNKMNYGEFVWKIDKINDKMKDAKIGINTEIYSESFYTHKHGYKMCLRVDPDGNRVGKGTHLSVYFCLMKGGYDDILQWPFKYAVTISLINQQTTLDHVSDTIKYDDLPDCECYNKPIIERNRGMGFHQLIELQELSTNANLTRNNQIFIKCSVNISS